jgi:hypothetical protein
VPGIAGEDEEAYIFLKLRKNNIWPIEHYLDNYTEDDLFDIIELLFDHISKPLKGRFHSWGNCGYHYDTFDKEAAQQEFIVEVNKLLKDYGNYELSKYGEIVNLAIPGTEPLMEEEIPEYDN